MSQYNVGQVNLVNGSQTVTGVGTLFTRYVTVGSVFTVRGSSVPYVVGGITDDTHLTLAAAYAGATANNVNYAITTSFTPTLQIAYPEQQDVDTATLFKRAMLQVENYLTSSVQITGGTIDGAVIGGKTPAAITGTTGTFSGALAANGGINGIGGATVSLGPDNSRQGNIVLRLTQMAGNSNIGISLLPSGTANISSVRLYNGSDPANTGDIHFQISGAQVSMIPQAWGTGTTPTSFAFPSLRMLVNTSADDGVNALQVSGPAVVSGNISAYGGFLSSHNSGTGQSSISWVRDGAGTDQKQWESLHASDGSFGLRAINDAYTNAMYAFQIFRPSGYSLSYMNLMPSGRVVIGGGGDDASNTLQVNGGGRFVGRLIGQAGIDLRITEAYGTVNSNSVYLGNSNSGSVDDNKVGQFRIGASGNNAGAALGIYYTPAGASNTAWGTEALAASFDGNKLILNQPGTGDQLWLQQGAINKAIIGTNSNGEFYLYSNGSGKTMTYQNSGQLYLQGGLSVGARALFNGASDDGQHTIQVNGAGVLSDHLFVGNMGRFKGVSSTGASGIGLEVGVYNSVPFVQGYDRTNVVGTDLSIGTNLLSKVTGGRFIVGGASAPADDGIHTLQVYGSGVLFNTPSATAGQLTLAPTSTANGLEGKLRFHATFGGTVTDLGNRLAAAIRVGFNGGAWGNEYMDFWLNSTANDAVSDANMYRLMRLVGAGGSGRVLVGNGVVDDGAATFQVHGIIKNDNTIECNGVAPNTDNTYNLGVSGTARWQNLYVVNAPVTGSDQRMKKDIETEALGLDFIMSLRPVSYRWRKHDNGLHHGLIAQEVDALLGRLGINSFAGLDKPEDGMMGLQYQEFIAPMIKAQQESYALIQRLMSRVDALETQLS